VEVVVSVDADEVELIVTDDGRGADAARLRDAARHGHLGVTEMRQRASRVGASLAISTDDGGTRVRVHWRP
jgi:signal transduction histidine kinase